MAYGVEPYLLVFFDNIDVSAYIEKFLVDFIFVDNDGLHVPQVDDVEIVVEDKDHFFSQNPPKRGSTLLVWFGYKDKIRYAGKFFIDSYTFRFSRNGSLFHIKALAKDVKSTFIEDKSVGYENTSLRKVAAEIAHRNGYELVWEAEDVAYKRLTQHQKRDLEYLHFLMSQYGYTVKVNDRKIIIREPKKVEKIFVLTGEHIINFDLTTTSLPEDPSKFDYLNPLKKENLQGKDRAKIPASHSSVKTNIRVENNFQAQKIAEAQAKIRKMREVKGTIETIGIPDIYATGKIQLSGFGKYDIEYYVASATHRITRSGYTTSLEVFQAVK